MPPLPALLLLLLTVGTVVAVDFVTYTKCSSQADCKDKKFPICTIFWTDSSFTAANDLNVRPVVSLGVCVQCENDCDCDLDEYCAHDFTIASLSSTTEIPTIYDEKTNEEIAAYAEQFKNLPIRSICKKRELPDGICNTYSRLTGDIFSIVESVDGYCQQLLNVIQLC
eukprot:759058-Hanusia_phi.AAC.3